MRLLLLALVLAPIVVSCRQPELKHEAVPGRMVAVAPGIVETLFALDLGARVVGVGNYAHWPPEVENLPRIGGLYDPRFETIATLEPDLAILVPSEAELAQALERLGVEVMIVPHESLADVDVAIAMIAERAGVAERGEELIADLRRGLEPRAEPLQARVLLSVARQPGRAGEIYAAGPRTFLGELLSRLGAANAASDGEELYPRLGFEEAVIRAPEVVLELQPEEVAPEDEDAWTGDWLEVAGDSAPCVKIVDGNHVLLPGPRVAELYRDLEAALVSCDPGRAS
ncbi:MAG: ABC transporter substrate-binding protein [bacterium]|nr:ABC transporter substrate-binding protein [bacterium]